MRTVAAQTAYADGKLSLQDCAVQLASASPWLYLQPEAGLYFPGHRLGQAASGAEEKRQNG
jgi:hypothetical protein